MTDIIATTVIEVPKHTDWGRSNKAGWGYAIGSFLIVTGCPTWCILNWIVLNDYNGSITEAMQAIFADGLVLFASKHFPSPSIKAFAGYAGWLLLQAFFYGYLPGSTCIGQRTPGGHLLSYSTNGLLAWTVTHTLYLGLVFAGLLDPAFIAKHWEGLLVAVNTYGFLLAILAQLKGYWAPSFPEDRKLSGSWIFDFFAGVELNPRLGEFWDVKFFHNGRPGIIAWTLIDLSWAAYQYQMLGHVTKSVLIVSFFHTLYVIDFFYNEDWYTRTIDITHDHFGFMLAWGDTTFLPTFYTLQVQYLARYPVFLTNLQAAGILIFGLTAYIAFRSANWQRDYVRSHDGDVEIWGKPAEVIRCKYRTQDGKEHSSILLMSGFWGISRHFNYLADLMQSWAMCAPCGYTHLLPWSYLIYMSILLCHRERRDEKKCRKKYGEYWDRYCEIVPYRFLPGLF